ncbi:MAG: ureidoglycolate lyase [Synergistaceae bacterium]|jgi:ureidoglycolate hydrolase|nr:ureidoglycolate lyase [Synergistaceae bacterium]
MKPIELSAEAFKEYGKVLHQRSDERRMSDNDELTYWGKIAEFELPSKISTGIMVARRREGGFRTFERHFKTGEILVALDADAVCAVGRPTPERDEVTDVKLFYFRRGQAVFLSPATWHYVPMPIASESAAFLVIFASGTEDDDMSFADLSAPLMAEVG